jgi:hypothetical protein
VLKLFERNSRPVKSDAAVGLGEEAKDEIAEPHRKLEEVKKSSEEVKESSEATQMASFC